MIHPGNAASIRVARAIGTRFEREQQVDGTTCVIYGQTSPERPR